MAEKKGNTVKLHYDFDTTKSTEIQIDDKWYRVTCKDFRSFNGPRRIMLFDKQNQPYYQEHKGNVYLFETNIPLRDFSVKGIVYPHQFNHNRAMLRPGEGHYLDDPKVKKQLSK